MNINFISGISSQQSIPINLESNGNICDGFTKFEWDEISIQGISVFVGYYDMTDTYQTLNAKTAQISTQYKNLDIIIKYNGELIEDCHVFDNLHLWIKIQCNQPSEFISMNLSEIWTINIRTKGINETNLIPTIMGVKEEFNNENDENILKIYWKEVSGAVKYRIYFGLNVLEFEDLPYIDIFSTPNDCKVLYELNADLLQANLEYAIYIEAYNSNNVILGLSPKVIYKTCQLDCYGHPLNLFTHSLSLLQSDYDAYPGSGYQIYIPVGNVNPYIIKYRIQYRIKNTENWIDWNSDILANDIPQLLRIDNATPDSIYQLRTLGLCQTGEWFSGPIIEVVIPELPIISPNVKYICVDACLSIDPNSIIINFTECCMNITWDGVENAYKYIIEWRRKGASNWERGYSYEINYNIESYNNKSLESNTEYEIRIATDCGNNISAFSLRKVVTTPKLDINLTPVITCLAPKFTVNKFQTNSIKITIIDFETGEYTLRWKPNNTSEWNYQKVYNREYILNNLSVSLLYDISLNRRCCCKNGNQISDWSNSQFSLAGGQCIAPSNNTHNIQGNVFNINWVNNTSLQTNILIQVVTITDDNFEQVFIQSQNSFSIGIESNWQVIRYDLWIKCGNINSEIVKSEWVIIRQNNNCNPPRINYVELTDINYGLGKTIYKFGITPSFNRFTYHYKIDLIDTNGIVIKEDNEIPVYTETGEVLNAEGPIIQNFNNVVKTIRFSIRTKCGNEFSLWENCPIKNPYFGENGEVINCIAPALILSLINNNSAIYWTYQPVNGAIEYITQYSISGLDNWITITNNIIYGVIPGNTYSVRIRSRCGQGIYSEWNTQNISIPPVSNLQCLLPQKTLTLNNTTLKVDWIWRIDLDTIILTLYNMNGLTIKSVSFNNSNISTYTFTNLIPNTEYLFKISSICDNGLLKEGELELVKTTNEPLLCPSIIQLNHTIIDRSINLTWVLENIVNPDTIINYTLQWTYNGDTFEQTISNNQTTWTINNLPRGININIKMKVNCLMGSTGYTEINVIIPVLVCLNDDINPIKVELLNSPGGEIRLNWNNPNNLKFEIQWWLKTTPNDINTNVVTTNTLFLTNLIPNSLYDFRFIKFCDIDVTAPPLPYNDVLSTPVPQTNCQYPITGLEAIDITCDTIQIRWNKANVLINEIEIRWNKLGDIEINTILVDKNEQYYTLSGLSEDTTYVISLYSICSNLTYSLPISIQAKTKPEQCIDCDSGMLVAQVKNNNIEVVWQNVGNWNKFKLQYSFNIYGYDTWETKTVIGKMYIIPNASLYSGTTMEIKVTTLGNCCEHGYNWTKTITYQVP